MALFPRFRPGVPATTATVATKTDQTSHSVAVVATVATFGCPGTGGPQPGLLQVSQLSQGARSRALMTPSPLAGQNNLADFGGLIDEPSPDLPPVRCPADVAERAAIIEDGDHCSRGVADVLALGESGLADWRALATAHRDAIERQLAALPPANGDAGHRLLTATRRFLASPHWHNAIRYGWPLHELFGIHASAPLADVSRLGLVTLIALSKSAVRIELITDSHAVIAYRSGQQKLYRLGGDAMRDAVVWWQCQALFGSLEYPSLNERKSA
jgi:hypothetical protein